MSNAELVEWMAYDRLDPIGPERADLGFARVSAWVAALSGKSTRFDEHMPKFDPYANRMSDEQLRRFFDSAKASHNAVIARRPS